MAAPQRWRRHLPARVEWTAGNHLTLLQNGEAFFPALIQAIDAARTEIFLETYIFAADRSTEPVRDALIRAARRGVEVKVLIDGVGSRELPAAWREALQSAGVLLRVYRPLAFGRLINVHSLRRLHRKVAVIDAQLAFVGGINLLDDFEPVCYEAPRLDFTVAIRGPVLASIHANSRRLWRLVALSQLQRSTRKPLLAPSWPRDGTVRAAFVVRDNFAHRRDIERTYLEALARAQRDIVIASAYFLPGRRFREMLIRVASRGVRVRILAQGHTDHPFFQAASRALYRDLLAAGVQIFEHHACELHAKVAVVDHHWSTVGSSNIDPFSLLLAREANVAIDDAAFAQELAACLERAIEVSTALRAEDWQRRGWAGRMVSRFAYAAVRWIVGLVGGGRWA